MNDPLAQRAAYIKSCELVRQKAVVRDIETGNILFDGATQYIKGINQAKKFVRKSGKRSYNI